VYLSHLESFIAEHAALVASLPAKEAQVVSELKALAAYFDEEYDTKEPTRILSLVHRFLGDFVKAAAAVRAEEAAAAAVTSRSQQQQQQSRPAMSHASVSSSAAVSEGGQFRSAMSSVAAAASAVKTATSALARSSSPLPNSGHSFRAANVMQQASENESHTSHTSSSGCDSQGSTGSGGEQSAPLQQPSPADMTTPCSATTGAAQATGQTSQSSAFVVHELQPAAQIARGPQASQQAAASSSKGGSSGRGAVMAQDQQQGQASPPSHENQSPGTGGADTPASVSGSTGPTPVPAWRARAAAAIQAARNTAGKSVPTTSKQAALVSSSGSKPAGARKHAGASETAVSKSVLGERNT
jgi:hypothetical protein